MSETMGRRQIFDSITSSIFHLANGAAPFEPGTLRSSSQLRCQHFRQSKSLGLRLTSTAIISFFLRHHPGANHE